MRAKRAFINFICWTGLALLTIILIYIFIGEQKALEFLGGYIVELSLSVDNLFLFLLIFNNYKIPPKYQKRVLSYGILGAMILRFVFIFVGVSIINKFHWVLFIFSLFLFISGIKMIFNIDSERDFTKSKLISILKLIIPVSNSVSGENFFVKKNNVLYATPLLLILILIESSDLIFALDSIPAIFSITTDPIIVYSSNIFAILGLRSLYFLLAKLNTMFKSIKYGIGFVLIFTGIKLFVSYFNMVIPTLVSLLIIFIILLTSILFSLIFD